MKKARQESCFTQQIRQFRARGPCSLRSFEKWLAVFRKVYGERLLNPESKEELALRRRYGEPAGTSFQELLFSVHTYFANVVRSTAAAHGIRLHQDEDLFGWAGGIAAPELRSTEGADHFKALYQALLPRAVRHALGEYYTPDWLAELMLSESGYDGDPEKRLLDPACGTGTFLVLAIRRARRFGDAKRILTNIRGFELNPLAALAARANYLIALGESGASLSEAENPIVAADAILGAERADLFDYVVGNPPWVRWDHLPNSYRAATLPLWKRYGLFSLKGFEAWLGAGQKDLSMLFTYAAADRYLKPGGTLALVITQEVLKSKGAGEGFRRFRIGEKGSPLCVRCAHDFTRLLPFEGVSNKTAGIVLIKGEETRYPVPYVEWRRIGKARGAVQLAARPLGSVSGPWRTHDGSGETLFPLSREAHYKPMLGANANPYGVFWLQIVEAGCDGLVTARNLAELGKTEIPRVTARLEAELIYPAVRGRDIARWRARPEMYVLIVQDAATRRAYPEETLRSRWPAAYAYLLQFRQQLLSRALFRRYHEKAAHPFYSQFNIAAETFFPFKVVWKRMSNDLSAAVVSRAEGLLGSKLVVPLETAGLIGCHAEEEAHYVCAVLNSLAARSFVKSFSAAGRGFGTPSVVRHLGVPRFDGGNGRHRRLAELSSELHARRQRDPGDGIAEREAEINSIIPALAG